MEGKEERGKSANKKVAKAWICSACGYINEANNFFFCQKCGQRNIETYG